MKKRKLNSSNEAVVGIVVAVLLIGLMVSMIALLQTQYVPQWMEEKEAEHMEQVIEQFTRMKFAIDTQMATSIKTPIATTITLGSKEMQFLLSQRSYGQLDILSSDDSAFRIQITTTDSVGQPEYDSDTDTIIDGIGTIRYSSSNAYYLDQSFIYESGAIITYQDDGYDMTIQPPIIYDDIDNKLIIKLVDVIGIGGKIQSSGYGSTGILTEFYSYSEITDVVTDESVSEILINSNYANAWGDFLGSLLDRYSISNTVENPSVTQTKITLSSPINFDLIYYEIQAQIGPGWIE